MSEAERIESLKTKPYRWGTYDPKATSEEDKEALDKALATLSETGVSAVPAAVEMHLAFPSATP